MGYKNKPPYEVDENGNFRFRNKLDYENYMKRDAEQNLNPAQIAVRNLSSLPKFVKENLNLQGLTGLKDIFTNPLDTVSYGVNQAGFEFPEYAAKKLNVLPNFRERVNRFERDASPTSQFAVSALSQIPALLASGGVAGIGKYGIGALKGLPRLMASGGLFGGISGAGHTLAKETGNPYGDPTANHVANEALGGAATGALLGAGFGGIGKAFTPATKRVIDIMRSRFGGISKPTLQNIVENPYIRKQVAKGDLHTKVAEVSEDYMNSLKGLDDQLKNITNEAYSKVNPQQPVNFNPEELASLSKQFGNIIEPSSKSAKTFNVVNENLKGGSAPFESLSQLKKQVRDASMVENISHEERNFLQDLNKYLANAGKAESPEYAKASELYSKSKNIQSSLEKSLGLTSGEFESWKLRRGLTRGKNERISSFTYKGLKKAQKTIKDTPELAAAINDENYLNPITLGLITPDIEKIAAGSRISMNNPLSASISKMAMKLNSPYQSLKKLARTIEKNPDYKDKILKGRVPALADSLPFEFNNMLGYQQIPKARNLASKFLTSSAVPQLAMMANRHRDRGYL